MKKLISFCMVILAFVLVSSKADAAANVKRLYNPNNQEHLFTKESGEISRLKNSGWRDEGTAWVSPTTGNHRLSVWRLYNPNTGYHHFTMREDERNNLTRNGWRNEGVVFYVYGLPPYKGSKELSSVTNVYRVYNPNKGIHHFTKDYSEVQKLVRSGWRAEGTAWWAG